MSSWQVGAVKISRVVEIVVPFPEGTIFPEATLKTLKPTPWLIPQFVQKTARFHCPCTRCLWGR